MSPAVRCALALLLAATPLAARAHRLKDLVDVEGFRPNQLTGVGLVVGLDGTGDDPSSFSTRRPLATLLRHLGATIDPIEIKARNTALVLVTADLPPFARPGMSLDVTVSSLGTARSLLGGTLIATGLKGADRETYALAQGPLTVGGFAVDAASGTSARKNHVTVARIPGGGRIEREAPGALPDREVVLLLRSPDFTTASRIAAAIDASLGGGAARVRDPAAVLVAVAPAWRGRVVDLVARLEAIEASPDAPARVVIDERTGTVVVGSAVTLGAAAVASGGITVQVSERRTVSQPVAPLSPEARTVTVPESAVEVQEKEGQLHPLAGAATVGDVAAALNALGIKPRELVAILQALKAAGALRAEIVVL